MLMMDVVQQHTPFIIWSRYAASNSSAINSIESTHSNLELSPSECHPEFIIGLLNHLIAAIYHAFEGTGSPKVFHCYTGDNTNNMSAPT
jgi:hypothetical protein